MPHGYHWGKMRPVFITLYIRGRARVEVLSKTLPKESYSRA